MEKVKEKAINLTLYPIYKMFSWDLLFYYSIIFLFLTQVKGLSAADVLLVDSFYIAFRLILLIPLTILIEKIGKRKSLIISNIILCVSTLTFILASNFIFIIIANFFQAFGFVIKNMAESNLLYDSLPKNSKRGNASSRIEGKGSSWYFYLNAISAVASGFLYVVNPYIPLVLCLLMSVVSTILSYKFQEVTSLNKSKQEFDIQNYIKNLKYSFRDLFKSSRLKNLIIFGALFSAFLFILVTLRSGLLEEINIPEQYFGIIFGVLEFVSGIAAKNQYKIHIRFKNKTLTILSIPAAISCLIMGIVVFCKLHFSIAIVIILLMYLIQYIAKAPFYNLIKQYLNNFTTSSLRGKIAPAYTLIEGVVRFLVSFAASIILNYATISTSVIYIGGIFSITFILLLDNMKTKVGLKPEQYKKKEIEFLELK